MTGTSAPPLPRWDGSDTLRAMQKSMYARVSAIPVKFPEAIEIQYVGIDPDTNLETGEAYKDDPRPWSEVRSRIVTTPDELQAVEETLKSGRVAHLGNWDAIVDLAE